MKITKHFKSSNYFWLILSTVLSFQANAQTSAERVNKALKSLDNITADFKQTVISDKQEVVQQAMGTVAPKSEAQVTATAMAIPTALARA